MKYDMSVYQNKGFKFQWKAWASGKAKSWIFSWHPMGDRKPTVLGYVDKRSEGGYYAWFPTEYADVLDYKITKTLNEAKVFIEAHYNIHLTKKTKRTKSDNRFGSPFIKG